MRWKETGYAGAEGNLIRAGAGELLARVARVALEHGLTGMEFAAGIPGSVGGALVMNAGAYGSEIKNILKSARVMTNEGEVLELSRDELKLGYRQPHPRQGIYGSGGILSAGTGGPGGH